MQDVGVAVLSGVSLWVPSAVNRNLTGFCGGRFVCCDSWSLRVFDSLFLSVLENHCVRVKSSAACVRACVFEIAI